MLTWTAADFIKGKHLCETTTFCALVSCCQSAIATHKVPIPYMTCPDTSYAVPSQLQHILQMEHDFHISTSNKKESRVAVNYFSHMHMLQSVLRCKVMHDILIQLLAGDPSSGDWLISPQARRRQGEPFCMHTRHLTIDINAKCQYNAICKNICMEVSISMSRFP